MRRYHDGSDTPHGTRQADWCSAVNSCNIPVVPQCGIFQYTALYKDFLMELVFFAFFGSLALIVAMVVKGEI